MNIKDHISNIGNNISLLMKPAQCSSSRDTFFDLLLETSTIIFIILAMFVLSMYTTQQKYQMIITWYFWTFVLFLIFLKILPSCSSNVFIL